MATLTIKNLHVNIEDIPILNGVNLEIKSGQTLALLGPNGHGKSTLLAAIMGHPKYTITKGNIYFNDLDITEMPVDERARLGIFYGMQNPSEIPGVVTTDFLKAALNSHLDAPIGLAPFFKALNEATSLVKMPMEMLHRSLNEGFSGGEKKRNEILQMHLFNPKFSMLDEIDSGLDIDALQNAAQVIKLSQAKGTPFLIISHYARLFQLVEPTHTAIMINGKIVLEGGVDLIHKIDVEGYEWIKQDLNIAIEKKAEKSSPTISLGTCSVKETTRREKK